jgi:gas vesicle structural protein
MRRHTRRQNPRTTKSSARMGLEEADVSLLDVIDHVLNQGIVLSGELTLGVADVDLIYIRLLALICSDDRARSSGAALGATSPLSAERRRA